MLDINRIRENPEKVKEALKKKLWDADFTEKKGQKQCVTTSSVREHGPDMGGCP